MSTHVQDICRQFPEGASLWLETLPDLEQTKKVDLDTLHTRLRKMSDDELVAFGRQTRKLFYLSALSVA
jgi:hypothetical protein